MGFIVRYIIESIQNGYYNNKYEREAREAEMLTSKLQVDFYPIS